jgi:hypothetical protein
MKKIILATITAFLGVTCSVQAETLTKSVPACLSEDLLDEVIGYAAKGDRDGTASLLANGQCMMIDAGEKVSVISLGFSVATIRYKGVKLFAPSGAIR